MNRMLRCATCTLVAFAFSAEGIHGQKIRLVTRDDAYKADETVRLAREVIETARPLALFGFVGTGNVETLLREDVLAAAGVPLITVRSGATSISGSRSPWLFLTRASYADEIDRVVRQYAGTGYRRFAVLYQNDPYGQDGVASVETAAGRYGATVVSKASYEKNTADVPAAAKALADAEPHAVIMVSNTAASAEFVRLSREAGNRAQLIALSVNDAAQIVERIGAAVAHGLAITQVVPDPADRTVPVSRRVSTASSRKASAPTTPCSKAILAPKSSSKGCAAPGRTRRARHCATRWGGSPTTTPAA